MKQKQKPLSFSLHPDNIAYIEAAVLKQKEGNHRYSRSMYLDDLITHLRTKAKPSKSLVVEIPVSDKPKVKRFKPPTVDEVSAYMFERTNELTHGECDKFHDFYESKGWLVGKAKMKCWKAAVRNWLKGNSNGQNNANAKSSGQKKSAVERVNERNSLKYGQPDECGLGVGTDGRHLGGAVDKGERGATIEYVDNEPFVDY